MSSRFEALETPIPGLNVLQRKLIADNRGYLERLFCIEELSAFLPPGKGIMQINHTLTTRLGAVRGLHFQYPPHADTKFVSCLRGEVFDVAVDLRQGSPAFLQWHAEILGPGNHKTLIVPEGFAHGFQTLTEDCEMLYFHTVAYQPTAEGGLNVQDPRLAISWPLPVRDLSPRDAAHALIADQFNGVLV